MLKTYKFRDEMVRDEETPIGTATRIAKREKMEVVKVIDSKIEEEATTTTLLSFGEDGEEEIPDVIIWHHVTLEVTPKCES